MTDDTKRNKYDGHTPGPWHLHEKDKYGGPEIHAEPAGTQQHYVVAVCRLHEAISDPIGNANGHLIAAAPELLRQRDALLTELKRLRGAYVELTDHVEPFATAKESGFQIDIIAEIDALIAECEKDNA